MRFGFVALIIVVSGSGLLAQEQPPVVQPPANQPPANRVPAAAARGRGAPGAFGGFVPGAPGAATPVPATLPGGAAQIEPPVRSSSSSGFSRPTASSRPLPAVIGKTLRFEVLIAEMYEQADAPTVGDLLELEKAGKLSFAHRMQLMTVESEPAFVQLGALTPRISGRTATNVSVLPIYSDINIGTIAQITGRAEDDGSIIAQIYVERSALSGGPEEAFDPGTNTPPKGIDRVLTQSTIRLTPGESQLIGGSQATQGKETSKTWIVVTGHVGAKSPTAKAAAKSP